MVLRNDQAFRPPALDVAPPDPEASPPTRSASDRFIRLRKGHRTILSALFQNLLSANVEWLDVERPGDGRRREHQGGGGREGFVGLHRAERSH